MTSLKEDDIFYCTAVLSLQHQTGEKKMQYILQFQLKFIILTSKMTEACFPIYLCPVVELFSIFLLQFFIMSLSLTDDRKMTQKKKQTEN